ncbi:McrB family protein [Shewanella sp. UCD-KL21]|uniref:McrB family protein n=1 Tax=Shewanella sp. UCD-KL21 TaxID=1917164 RepID=UPI0009705271|nr:AAA family ATPase [Shewanella sp. UCD-KL21]
MLSELNMVGKWSKLDTQSSWNFGEIRFDERSKDIFEEELDLQIKIFDHSAKINVSSNNNHCYIPSHYFLYAIKLAPLVLLVKNYIAYFERAVQALPDADAVGTFITNKNATPSELTGIDSYSLEQFYDVFDVLTAERRLKAKEIINGYGKTSATTIRPSDDFLRSVVLKALPVPDNSSEMLSRLVCAFSKSQVALQHLTANYNAYLPHLFRSTDGDELLLMILSTLGWQGLLDSILNSTSGRYCSWGEIDNAFLLSTTPVSGNTLYTEKPVHYSTSLAQYVHVKKGLLETDELIDSVSLLISILWPNMAVHRSEGELFFRASCRSDSQGIGFDGASNKIFYGAPGTGKSHKIHTVECIGAEKVVTVFHPDTQYNDFVGALKPMMQTDLAGNPTVTYQFRPGPFTNALVKAKRSPSTHVCLVIEEINRAPAAAVFGELFQLLDRNATGESTYKIDAADPDMLLYINEQLRVSGVPELTQLEIPSNLSILATMNSSDQAVMPLDTAFKRRWSFEYLGIDFSNSAVPQTVIEVSTGNGKYAIKWPDLAKAINDVLMETGIAEDRLIGPFFLNPKELSDPSSANDALNGKLFVYLWDDVLRHIGQHKVFSSSYKTFGGLSAAFNKGLPVFSAAIEGVIEVKGEIAEVPEAAEDAGE